MKKRLIELKEKHENLFETKGLTNHNCSELIQIAEKYELALTEIYRKGSLLIRGNVANELSEIANKVLNE